MTPWRRRFLCVHEAAVRTSPPPHLSALFLPDVWYRTWSFPRIHARHDRGAFWTSAVRQFLFVLVYDGALQEYQQFVDLFLALIGPEQEVNHGYIAQDRQLDGGFVVALAQAAYKDGLAVRKPMVEDISRLSSIGTPSKVPIKLSLASRLQMIVLSWVTRGLP